MLFMNSLGFKVLKWKFSVNLRHSIGINKETMMMSLLVQFKMAANWHFQIKYGQNTDQNKSRKDKDTELIFAHGTSIVIACIDME